MLLHNTNRTYPVILPSKTRSLDLFIVLSASLFIALMAQVSIPLPFTPVPITGQTFAVLLVGSALGSKRGAAALVAYLAEGAAGLPVFAGGTAGAAVLAGPTGGYLIGFVAAAFVVGSLAERGLERKVLTAIPAFLAGTALIYFFGVAWLASFTGLDKALAGGLYPFLIGDTIKIFLASLALPAAWRLTGREE